MTRGDEGVEVSGQGEKNESDEERPYREDREMAYKEAKARLSALSDNDKERLFAMVKAELPKFIGQSRLAVEALAIELISKAPGCLDDLEEMVKASSDS